LADDGHLVLGDFGLVIPDLCAAAAGGVKAKAQ
jgi:hypothetical protein